MWILEARTNLIFPSPRQYLISLSLSQRAERSSQCPSFTSQSCKTGDSVVKNPPANSGGARDIGLIPGLGRSPGGGNGNPLQYPFLYYVDFPGSSDGKASAYNEGDLGSIPGLGRTPGEGNGNPLQYSCLENPMDGEAW